MPREYSCFKPRHRTFEVLDEHKLVKSFNKISEAETFAETESTRRGKGLDVLQVVRICSPKPLLRRKF